MNNTRTFVGSSLAVLLLAGISGAVVAEQLPTVELETKAVVVGIGGQSGEGTLSLDDLGSGCTYGFKVKGFGAGVAVGVTKVNASGFVKDLRRLDHFPGKYGAAQASATLVKGVGVLNLSNKKSGVGMELKSKTEGISLGIGGEGMTIEMKEPIAEPERRYVVYFDTNSADLDADAQATLRQVATDWRCRYPSLELVGHTDTRGNAEHNRALSERRAAAVQGSLKNAGVRSDRLVKMGMGQENLLKATGDNVNSELNRAVVVTVQ